jgi:hypothetical protein
MGAQAARLLHQPTNRSKQAGRLRSHKRCRNSGLTCHYFSRLLSSLHLKLYD